MTLLGAFLGPSDPFGAFWGFFWVCLIGFWGILGRHFGVFSILLEHYLGVLGPFLILLGHFGGLFLVLWGQSETLGAFWGHLTLFGVFWGRVTLFGVFWGYMTLFWGVFWGYVTLFMVFWGHVTLLGAFFRAV